MCNPYQDVIDWLRSPDGELWSEQRMTLARDRGFTLTDYGVGGPLVWKGIMSFKADDNPLATALFLHGTGPA